MFCFDVRSCGPQKTHICDVRLQSFIVHLVLIARVSELSDYYPSQIIGIV